MDYTKVQQTTRSTKNLLFNLYVQMQSPHYLYETPKGVATFMHYHILVHNA